MKTLALYVKPANTVINLKLAPNAQVLTCVVFVRQWINGNPATAATWQPANFMSPQGASITMQQCDGYDFIMKAQITGTPDTASVDPVFSINGAAVYTDTIHLPSAEGPVVVREWSVIE
jgi:hypothetical protein